MEFLPERRDIARMLPSLVEIDHNKSNEKKKEWIPGAPGNLKAVHKKNHKRNRQLQTSEISNELEEIKNDVVKKNSDIILQRQLAIADQFIPSHSAGKLYLEKKEKFKVKNKSDLEKNKSQSIVSTSDRWNEQANLSWVLLAQMSHKIFMKIALFIQGTFSGIALWQMVSTYSLFQVGLNNFLVNYSMHSMPMQCCHYFLYSICIVSSFDRYDIFNVTKDFIKKLLTLQNGAICIVLYTIGFVANLSNYKIDSYVWQYSRNSSVWTDMKDADSSSMLQMWQIINLVRGVAIILGWFIISLSPLKDNFLNLLDQLKNKNFQA